MRCKNCNAENEDDALFCENCGAPLNDNSDDFEKGRQRTSGIRNKVVVTLILVFGVLLTGTGVVSFALSGDDQGNYSDFFLDEAEDETEEQTEKKTESETETEKQTEKQTEKLTEKKTESETETEKLTEKQTEKLTEKKTESETETEKQTEKQTEKLTEKQTAQETEDKDKATASDPNKIVLDGSLFANGQSVETEDGYILPNSGSAYLTSADIEKLSLKGICYAKNEIYAKHGRKFSSTELDEYFNSMPWYSGFIDPEDFTEFVVNTSFNDYEKENMRLLADSEASFGGYQLDQ